MMMWRPLSLLAAAALCLISLPAAPAPVHAHIDGPALGKIKIENIVLKLGDGTIGIDAPILNGTGNFVTVRWNNVGSPFPGNMDFIAAYAPDPNSYTDVYPSKYKWIVPDASGSGSTRLWLLNQRSAWVLAYFTGGLDNPVMLAKSAPIEFSNYHIPHQIHLAMTDNPTEMRVHWTSMQNSFPSLNWGTSPDKLDNTIMRVYTSTYEAKDMCAAPATTKGFNTPPGYMHWAIIEGLQPNTKYYYTVGDESSGSQSEVLSFYSPPRPEPTEDVDFVIFGDLGQVEIDGSNEASQMEGSILTTMALEADVRDGLIPTDKAAAIFHIGDISYARGYSNIWDQFFHQISNITSVMGIPWMVSDGNHERDSPDSGSLFNGTDSGGECGIPFQKHWAMPTPALFEDPDQTWWSLNYGPIHFIMMSTEHDFRAGALQRAWIEKDLASVNRSATPFIIFTGHRPAYIDSTYRLNWDPAPSPSDLAAADLLRKELEPLWMQYRVDVIFWGHHHSYQRTCPVYNMTCTEGAPIHIVTGAAGAHFSTNIEQKNPEWIEFVEDHIHGYVRAKVRSGKLMLEFVSSHDRSIVDSITVSMQKFDSPFPRRQAPTPTPRKKVDDQSGFYDIDVATA